MPANTAVCNGRGRGISEELELNSVLRKYVQAYLLSGNYNHLICILKGIHNFIALKLMSPCWKTILISVCRESRVN